MQKDHLPRLELDGFETRGQYTAPAAERRTQAAQGRGWRVTAEKIAEKAGLKIVWKKQKPTDEIDVGYKRLLVKTGICAAVAIAILIIGAVSAPETQYTEAADDAISKEFDIDEDIGRLKFVQTLDDEVESVMSVLPGGVVVYPSDGDVITTFGQSGAKGVRFSSEGETAYSIARATVTAVGEIDGQGYVKLLLDTGETALYCNIASCVLVDDIVSPGQSVGTLTGDYLYVEMKSGEEYIDPIAYIGAQGASAE